jgi:RNA polymerase sigma-70 factor (ECF subfamily)
MFAWLDESQRLHLIDQAVNAALFKVWQSAREFRGEARVLTWVQRIAQLKLFEAYRQLYPLIARQSQSIHVEPAEDEARSDPLRDIPADEGRSAEDVVSRWKDLEAVQHCLGKLSPQQRRSIELVYVDCKTQKEAAEDQGVTRDTLAQRLRWAIKNLTACVKKPQVAKPLGGVL